MAIGLDLLQAMLTRSARASGAQKVSLGQAAAWRAYGGQACASIWNRARRVRVVRAGQFDVAYFPWEGATGRREEDAIFTAAAREDLPQLLAEWRALREILAERHLRHRPPVPISRSTVERLEQTCRQATAGPWITTFAKQIDSQLFRAQSSLQIVVLANGGDVCHVHPGSQDGGRHDARFIAQARWAVPRLATNILAMRKELADADEPDAS